jgi:cytochrome c-type biogenesis protein CcmH/NrfG
MRRDTLAFGLAGIVFGFALGYMGANWGLVPRPAVAARAPAGGAAAATRALDPNELRALESLAAREPRNAPVRVELGNLLMDHERWEEAIRWYREALAVGPPQPDVLTDLGACLVHSGRPAEGLVEFDRALAMDAGHKNAAYNKGVALMQMGRAAEAATVWRELMRRYPEDPRLQDLRRRIDQPGTPPGTGRR